MCVIRPYLTMVSTRGKAAENRITEHEQQTQKEDLTSSTRAQRSSRASAGQTLVHSAAATNASSQPRRGRPPKVPVPSSNPSKGRAVRSPRGLKAAQPASVTARASSNSDEASDEDINVGTVVYKTSDAANESHLLELSSDEENDENLVVASIITFKSTGKRALDAPDSSCATLVDTQVPGSGQGKRMRASSIIRTPLSPRSNSQQVLPDDNSQAAELCAVNCNAFTRAESLSQTVQHSVEPACMPLVAAKPASAGAVAVAAGTAAAVIAQQPAVTPVVEPEGPIFDPSSEEHVLMARSALSVSRAQNFGDADIDASDAPVGRQQQFDQLLALLEQSGQHQTSRGTAMTGAGVSTAPGSGSQTVYASGLPGTGKSLTVTALLRSMRSQPQSPATVWVSCNAFKETSEVFAVLLRECTLELIGKRSEFGGVERSDGFCPGLVVLV